MTGDPIARRLGVTSNPVEVHEFVAPQPKIDPRDLGGFISTPTMQDVHRLQDRNDDLEKRVAALERMVDDILRVISNLE